MDTILGWVGLTEPIELFIVVIVILVVLLLIAWIVGKLHERRRWSLAVPFEIKAKLLSSQYGPDTSQAIPVVVATSNGAGVGVGVTGNGEEYITVWDCGKYGRIICDKKDVFRWAKPESTLIMKQVGEEVGIVGIKR